MRDASNSCMLRVALCALFVTVPALLSAQNEVVLQRKAGKLLLNTEWGFWNPFRISQISIPYKLDALPPPPWS